MAKKWNSADKNFFVYRNLYYYPRQWSEVNLQDHFFYFKTLLTDYAPGYNSSTGAALYRQRANELGETAKTMLSRMPQSEAADFQNSIFVQQIEQAIRILKQGIEYEKINEQKYINEKIEKIRKNFDLKDENAHQLINMFNNLQANDGFDYAKFIDLLNSLLLGVNNAQASYKYEVQRIEETQKRMVDAYNADAAQLEGLAKIQHKQIDEYTAAGARKLYKQSVKTYVQKHTYDIESNNIKEQRLKKHLIGNRSTKTIDVILADKVTKGYYKLLNSPETLENLRNIIQREYKNKDKDHTISEQEIKKYLIEALMIRVNQSTDEILDNPDNFDLEALTLDLQNSIHQVMEIDVEGLYSNFGQYGRNLQFFKTGVDELESEIASGEGLYDALQRFSKELKGKKIRSEYTEDQRQVHKIFFSKNDSKYKTLMPLMDKIEQFQKKIGKKKKFTEAEAQEVLESFNSELKTYKITFDDKNGRFTFLKQNSDLPDEYEKIASGKNFDSLVSQLKKKMSEQIRETLTEAIQNQKKVNRERIKESLRIGLGNIKVSIGGPKYSEVIQLLTSPDEIAKIHTGGTNVKNDTIIISVVAPDIDNITRKIELSSGDFLKTLSSDLQSKLSPLYDTFGRELSEQIMGQAKTIQKERTYTDYDKLATNFYELSAKRNELRRKIQDAFNEVCPELRDLVENEKNQDKRIQELSKVQQQLMNELQDTLYISSTMKTFNNYQDKVGFVGGSIGSNIINQINSLNQIFEKAGIGLNPEEIDWLISACINCSSLSVVGTKNKDLLETFLGSLAIFALFDEGGAEVEILKEQVNNAVTDVTRDSLKIMHLYRMNGIYYPGSFVLTQALKKVEEMYQMLLNNVSSGLYQHNNIEIVNEVTFNMLPNRAVLGGETTDSNGNDLYINEHPWETVRDRASENTKIHILFLAGLLDILRELRKDMEIELPKN